jgi:hypothetical protein
MGKLFAKMREQEGAVNPDNADMAMLNCLRSPSPSVNWTFATPGFGIPFGTHSIFWGPPKSGKSFVANMFAGQLHQDDPDALILKYNSELRGEIQGTNKSLSMFGIDKNRWQELDRNQPDTIFDHISTDVDAMCQAGEKVRMIIIDSSTNIQGRRSMNADTIMTQQIGDNAATLKDGFMQILPIIRKHKIALISTAHARAELDQQEQMRGKKIKMASAWATKHLAEYFCYVEPNQSKDGKTSLLEESFTDDGVKDFMEHSRKFAHKIRFRVTDSSTGEAGRTGEFTIDYDRGIINQYEEIALMGVNLGIVQRPNNQTYVVGSQQIRGFANYVQMVRDNAEVQQYLAKAIMEKNASTRTGT